MTGPVLVTGGTGVVGSSLMARLLEEGREVRALARSADSAETLSRAGAVPVRGDISDGDSLTEGFAGCEMVYHVAGRVEFCPRDPHLLYEVNVGGTRNVMRAARRAGVRRVVYTSSVVALGEQPGAVGSESSVHRGWFMTHYERSKYEGEAAAFAEAGDMEVVAVLPASVQGAGRSRGSGRLLLNLINERYRVMTDSYFSIVDMDDCARGHVLAGERGEPGARYVLSGFTCTVRELTAMLDDMIGRRSRMRFLPKWSLLPLSPAASLLGRFVKSAPVCAETVRLARAGARYDGSRASRELGLAYRTARQTLAQTLDWFRAEGLTSV